MPELWENKFTLGIGLGSVFPSAFHALGGIEFAHINLPVAVLIWAMILPILLKIDHLALNEVWEHRRGGDRAQRGWRGKSEQLLIGSTSERVACHAPCPVMVIYNHTARQFTVVFYKQEE